MPATSDSPHGRTTPSPRPAPPGGEGEHPAGTIPPRHGGDESALVRRRLTRVVIGSFVTGLALSGITVILPLYATGRLGLSNAAFARVLSLRMTGITVGVILLGALSDRFGTKRLTSMSLALGGACYALLGFVPLWGFLVLIPALSGFLSTAFVNLNHLTQVADVNRQGRSNTLYRATGTLAGILAPILMTRLLHAIEFVFAGVGVALCAGAVVLQSYPIDERSDAFRGWAREFATLAAMYRRALAQRHLMRFIHLSLLWGCLVAAVNTFAAIRLTDELHASAALYGNTCSLASALTLGGILALGLVLDRRSLKRITLWLYALASLCAVAMGMSGSVVWTAVFWVVFSVAFNSVIAPGSMWVSRESESIGLSTAFSVHKVLSAAYLAAATFGFGLVEPLLGIRRLFLVCGIASVLALGALLLLRDPPQRRGGAGGGGGL